MIKAILIDDEKHCTSTLQFLLEQQKDIEIVSVINDSREAKKAVEIHNPDLVFLDIEMPFLNGFEFINQFEKLSFKLIFTTAYNQYAIKALRLNALDYLLKPIDEEDLNEALNKCRTESVEPIVQNQIQNLHLFYNGKIQDTIALSTAQGLIFVKIDDIMYFEASSCYTYLVMNDSTKHLASKTMANFEDILFDNHLFFRAHKSFVVNLKFIKEYMRGEGGDLIMLDGKWIPLSRNKKQEFLGMFKKV
jgi:two-component system LytT family response regulator